jgi:hypothetical protein
LTADPILIKNAYKSLDLKNLIVGSHPFSPWKARVDDRDGGGIQLT